MGKTNSNPLRELKHISKLVEAVRVQSTCLPLGMESPNFYLAKSSGIHLHLNRVVAR